MILLRYLIIYKLYNWMVFCCFVGCKLGCFVSSFRLCMWIWISRLFVYLIRLSVFFV